MNEAEKLIYDEVPGEAFVREASVVLIQDE